MRINPVRTLSGAFTMFILLTKKVAITSQCHVFEPLLINRQRSAYWGDIIGFSLDVESKKQFESDWDS